MLKMLKRKTHKNVDENGRRELVISFYVVISTIWCVENGLYRISLFKKESRALFMVQLKLDLWSTNLFCDEIS